MKKAINLALIISLIISVVFVAFEPQNVKAVSHNVIITAEVTEEISITSPVDITLNPSIPGITGNAGSPATGSVTWTVKTSNAAGFNMKINATTDPALQLEAGEFFDDYTPAVAGSPDFDWASPDAASAEFGFTVEPETVTDTDSLFIDDGADCDVGALNGADTCWLDFNGQSNIDIINRSTATGLSGEDEVVKFWAESNAKHLKEGNYTATIQVTATMN